MVAGMEKETITTIKIGYLNHKVQHIFTVGNQGANFILTMIVFGSACFGFCEQKKLLYLSCTCHSNNMHLSNWHASRKLAKFPFRFLPMFIMIRRMICCRLILNYMT